MGPARPRAAEPPARPLLAQPPDDQLSMLLQKHGLMRFSGLFSQFELTIDELQHWTLPALLELLKALAGPTRRFLEEVQNMTEACSPKDVAKGSLRLEHI